MNLSGLGADVAVAPSRFVGVVILTTVRVRGAIDPGLMTQEVLDTLYLYFHPLVGGPKGRGWPFGQAVEVADLRKVLAGVRGISGVDEVMIFPADPRTGRTGEAVDRIVLGDQELVFATDKCRVRILGGGEYSGKEGSRRSVDLQARRRRLVAHRRKTMPATRRQVLSGLIIALAPVILGVGLQIADKASAPIWAIIALIAAAGIATMLATARQEMKQDEPGRLLTGKKAPGELEIADVKVTSTKDRRGRRAAIVDFRVTNIGGSTVSIHEVEFEVIRAHGGSVSLGIQDISAKYDLDITDLTEVGDRASCYIAQAIRPGEVDRFTITLTSGNNDYYIEYLVRPTLLTNFGPVPGEPLDLVFLTGVG
jgi:hypothetical protein